jgi:hypothetical protein
MCVKTVAIQLNMEASLIALRTNLYLSALDSRSQSKNCVVRDQCFSFREVPLLPSPREWGSFIIRRLGSRACSIRTIGGNCETGKSTAVYPQVPGRGNQGVRRFSLYGKYMCGKGFHSHSDLHGGDHKPVTVVYAVRVAEFCRALDSEAELIGLPGSCCDACQRREASRTTRAWRVSASPLTRFFFAALFATRLT